MGSNKKFLRNLLTTASALAVMAGGANEAVAAAARQALAAGASNLNTGVNLDGGGGVPFVTGSTLEFAGARDVRVNIAGVNILAIDTHSHDNTGRNLLITENASIGSMIDLGAGGNVLALVGAANQARIRFDAIKTVTLTGTDSGLLGFFAAAGLLPGHANNYSALSNVNFNNNIGAELVINDGQTIYATIDDDTGNGQGILKFIGAGTVIGDIGTQGIAEIQLGLAANNNANVLATLKGAVIKAATITLSADSVVGGGNHSSTLVLDSSVGAQVLTGAIDSTAAVNGGTSVLNFVGANGTTVTGKIGNGNELTAINLGLAVNNDANVLATLKGAVIKAATITLSANSVVGGGNHSSTLVLDSSVGAQVLTGAIDSTAVANAGTSVLKFVGANGTTVTGKIGNGNALTAINIGLLANNDANVLATLKGAVIKATTITLSADSAAGQSSTLVLDSSVGAQVLTGAIDSTAVANAGTSVLNFVGANGTTVTGKIGNGNELTAINLGLAVNNDANVLATLKGAVIKAATITLSANSVVGGGNHSSTLVLDSSVGAQVLTGAIDSTAVANAGTSVLKFVGANGTTVTGKIGNGNALTAINIGLLANNDANVLATLKGAVIKATTITLSADSAAGQSSTLVLDSSVGAQVLTGAIDSTAVANAGTSVLNFIGGNGTEVTGKIGNGNTLTAINIGLLANNDANVLATLKGAVIKATTITLSADSAAGQSSTLVLDSSVGAQVLTGAIDSTAVANAGTSVLNFVGANGTTVTGKIGNGNELTAINLGLAVNNDANVLATLKGAVIKAATITLSANSVVGGGNHSSTLVLDSSVGAQVLTGAIDSTAVANAGTSVLKFVGANGTTVTGKIGNGNALTAINIGLLANNNANASATLQGAVIKAATITLSADSAAGQSSTLVLDSSVGAQVLTGAIDSTAVANAGTSVLKFVGANGTAVTGKIGNGNELTAINLGLAANNNANVLATLQGSVIKATTITLSADSIVGGGNHSSTLVLDSSVGAQVLTGAIDSTAVANAGTSVLNFIGANGTEVTGKIGNGNTLTAINLGLAANNNANVLATLKGAVIKATTITLSANSVVGGGNHSSTLVLDSSVGAQVLTGAIDSTAVANAGTSVLNFVGANGTTVTGNIGAANALTLVQLNGNAPGNVVTFGGLLKAATLDLAGAQTKAQLDAGALIDTLTIANANSSVNIANGNTLEFTGTNNAINLAGNNGKITFGGNNSVLKFNSVNAAAVTVTFNADLNPGAAGKGKIILNANGAGSTLILAGGGLGVTGGVNKLLSITVTGDQLVTINSRISTALLAVDNGAKLLATSNIAGKSTLTTIGVASELEYRPTADMQIAATNFANANSVLKLTANGADRTFTLLNHIDPGGNGQGLVILHGDGQKTTLDGAFTLGTGGNHIAELRATIGALNGTSEITANVDITNVNLLTVGNGATLNSLTKTAFDIAQTNIGEVGGGGILILDAQGAAAIDVLNGKALSFEHANSLLKLTNVTNGNHATFTLKTKLAPGGGADLIGNLQIHASNNKTITVTKNVAESIGTDKTHRLRDLLISGDQAVTIDTGVFAKNITISSTANVTLGAVDSGVGDATKIQFTADGGILAFAGNVTTKTIDINGSTRTITVAHGMALNLDDITNGANSQMTFLGGGNLNLFTTKTVNIGKITAVAAGGAKVVTLGAGAYTVPEIRVADAALNSRLELANGFNLTGGFNTTGGAAGIVKFLGSSSVSGALGTAGNALGAVTVAGVGTTLQVGGEVAVASLDGTVGNAQNLKFINAGDIDVAGVVGGIQQFTEIEFNGAHEVDFANLQSTDGKALNFTANAIVITTGYDLGTTNINGVADGALIIDKIQTITGDITNFGTLGINGNHIVNINTANFAANIKTKTGGEGTVNFNNAGAAAISIGQAGTKINTLNFSAAKAVGNVYANNISILANGNATFNGVIDANQIKFTTAATSIANFGAGPLTARLVSEGGSGKGIANFAGTGIDADVGAVGVRLAQANFAPGQVSAINANIYANAINVNGTITMTRAGTFDGASTFAGATIALGGNDLTFNNGAVVFNGNSTISTKISVNDLGNLAAGAGSNITVNGKMEIQVDPLPVIPNNGQKVTLIKRDGGALNLNLDNITVTKHGGAFAQWRKEIGPDGSLILTNEAQIAEISNDAAAASDLSDVVTTEISQAFEDFVPGTQGADVLSVFNTFITPDGSRDKFAIADGEARLANTTANEIVGATFETVSTMTDQINARMFDVGSFASSFAPAPDVSNVGQSQGASFTPAGNQPASGPATTSSPAAGRGSGGSGSTNVDAPAAKAKSTKVSANELSGIAAGDQSDRYGIWATPFYLKSTQKKRGSSAGYKSDGYGGTFGFDTRANEEMIVGLAVTAMNSDIKHKDFKSGDKTKVGTILFSAYSNYQFGNNWFGQGVFSIGSSNVTNKEKRRISTTNYSIASAEYSSMTFASEVLGGYNHLVNNQLVLTPMFGVGYSRINDSSYQETGNGPQLLSVTKRASQKVELVGGLRVTGLPFIVGEVSLTPEMHGSVRHDVIGKGARVDAKIPGLPKLPSEKAKLQKTYYNLGASLKASYGMMDYGVAADTMFAKKYVGVNGSVNVRVNF